MVPCPPGGAESGTDGAWSGAGASWLLAQFPAPLKSRGCAPCFSGPQGLVCQGRGELRDQPPPEPHPTSEPKYRAAGAYRPAMGFFSVPTSWSAPAGSARSTIWRLSRSWRRLRQDSANSGANMSYWANLSASSGIARW